MLEWKNRINNYIFFNSVGPGGGGGIFFYFIALEKKCKGIYIRHVLLFLGGM